MKEKITLKRIFHRDRWRIAMISKFNREFLPVIKSVKGSVYSSTHKCFYINDNEEDIKEALAILREFADVDISGLLKDEEKVEEVKIIDNQPVETKEENVYPDGYWPPEDQLSRIGPAVQASNDTNAHDPVEFRIDEGEGSLVIKFMGRYEQEWISEMRSYGSCYYNKNKREWMLKWSKLTVDSLADYFASNGINVVVKRRSISSELQSERKQTGDEVRARPLCDKAKEGLESMAMYLDECRYSRRTREAYLSALEFFFRYFSGRDPFGISHEEISIFVYDFIIRFGYSESYQNQMVSAIKAFYSISGKGKVRPAFLERPRRSRALPKVFSKEEVSLILNSVSNLKHKLVLWMIYSCGLRRSEVINISLADLDRERNILHIREGKGMVDRIVPLPPRVWEKIDEYMAGYRPKNYLFEGQTGGKYSAESVYNVFKGALRKAGIGKDVGVHCLRHSYATHLHENGLDIRYIQELLGHKSSRTTEIYTHVSRRNLVQVRSPIEDLDLK